MAGSLPRLPQRLMVKGETRRISATSLTVSRSGRLLRSRGNAAFLLGFSSDMIGAFNSGATITN